MSPSEPERSAPPPESDSLPLGRLLLIAAAVLGLFVLGICAAELERRHVSRALGPGKGLPAELGQKKINLVEQQLFELNLVEEKRRQAQAQRLHNYGWVDRAHGIVHVPIEKAREQLLSGKAGGP